MKLPSEELREQVTEHVYRRLSPSLLNSAIDRTKPFSKQTKEALIRGFLEYTDKIVELDKNLEQAKVVAEKSMKDLQDLQFQFKGMCQDRDRWLERSRILKECLEMVLANAFRVKGRYVPAASVFPTDGM